MNFTAPDTNVVIFRFLGGESDKKSAAENYFEKVSSGDFDGVIFHEVNNEYRKVVNREVSDIREFVNKAVDKGSWSAAESSLTVDTDFASNFLESLKQRCDSVGDGHRELNKMKKSMFSSFRRRKKKYFKEEGKKDFDENLINKVKSKIPSKGPNNDETETDARIVLSAFHFSNYNSENLKIVSDDFHMTELNYKDVEDILDYSNYNKYVRCTPLEKFN